MKFRATLEPGCKTATGLRVPPHVVAALGTGRRPAVRDTINGFTYPSTIAVMGGEFTLPVSGEVRANAGIAAGDEVEVDVQLDTEVRRVSVPDDFAAALDADSKARAFSKDSRTATSAGSCSRWKRRRLPTPVCDG